MKQRQRRPTEKMAPGTASHPTKPTGLEPPAPPAVSIELGELRIHLERAADLQTVLQPLLQVASQKNLSQLLGISTRTLQRWQRNGRLPPMEGQTLAQLVGRMVTFPGSGA